MTKNTDITTEQPPAAVTPAEMLRVAVEQGADLDKLEKLMDLQHRWEADQARKAFSEAIANFKAHAPRLIRDSHASFGQGKTAYSYSTLDRITQKLAPALAKWGLSHSWSTSQDGDRITVTCRLSHRGGHFEEVSLSAAPDTSGSKNAVQSIGSTATYLSRYTLLAVTGLATGTDDDDGHATRDTLVTAEQKGTLAALIKETGSDTKMFLEWLGVPTLGEVPARRFAEAKQMLERKRDK